MKKENLIIAGYVAAFLMLPLQGQACTSAVVGAGASPYGRPMLWKHRDTSTIDNKVEYVAPKSGRHAYVALFNASDRTLAEAWTGMNDVGFAIMNTASYNIKDDNVPASKMDREGYVMTLALQSCRTVDDFARLLDELPRPMGVEANFGVIDALGNGAYFETNNHSYVRFNLEDAPDGVMIRTNYSHSGREEEGYGFVREANALHLITPLARSRQVTPEFLTEVVSRSFYHDMFGRDFAAGPDRWAIDQDFIPRYKSTATIVIEGCIPVDDISEVRPFDLQNQYVMWTGLGYPPVAEIVPVWCRPDGVDSELRGIGKNGHSEAGDRAKARRDEVFPIHKGNGDKYIDMHVLYNDAGTGYMQTIPPSNLKTYSVIRRKRDGAPLDEEMARLEGASYLTPDDN